MMMSHESAQEILLNLEYIWCIIVAADENLSVLKLLELLNPIIHRPSLHHMFPTVQSFARACDQTICMSSLSGDNGNTFQRGSIMDSHGILPELLRKALFSGSRCRRKDASEAAGNNGLQTCTVSLKTAFSEYVLDELGEIQLICFVPAFDFVGFQGETRDFRHVIDHHRYKPGGREYYKAQSRFNSLRYGHIYSRLLDYSLYFRHLDFVPTDLFQNLTTWLQWFWCSMMATCGCGVRDDN